MIRKLLIAGCALGSAFTAAAVQARNLDPAKPEDALEIRKRVQCGIGETPAIMYWSGRIYSRVTGEPDRHLFDGVGMNIRSCAAVTDAKRGAGFRLVSREVMFFTDAKTGQIIRTWTNPWTNEKLEVVQIANDPVNQPASFARGPNGEAPPPMRLERVGEWALMPLEVPLFYTNPLGGDYQDYVGNQYHAMEIFDFAARADQLFDTKYPTTYPNVSWVRISDWMPWMKMRGRQGQIVFNAMGAKVKSFVELPKVIKDEIMANYPQYTTTPPADDTRRNSTTWTVVKQRIDEERKAESETANPPRRR